MPKLRKYSKVVEYLIQMEEDPQYRDTNPMWSRNSDGSITISTVGYVHMDHIQIEEKLLSLGCRYSFAEGRGVQQWDKFCGRTFSTFSEPAKSRTKNSKLLK